MNTDKSNLLQTLFEDDKNSNSVLLSINSITEKIIGCSFTVSNSLGCGFFEKVYENALVHELRKSGLTVSQQHLIKVYYDGIIVGDYVADLLIGNTVIVEVKAIKGLEESHIAQCLNYLKATKQKIALLINFGKPKIEIRRVVL